MANNQGHPTHLICLWDPRFDLDHLAADPAAVGSYSEAGPRPGTAVSADPLSRLIPVVSFDQAQDVDLRVEQGGAVRRDGVQVSYRLGSETLSNDYRGWFRPNHLTAFGWLEVNGIGVAVYDRLTIATIPSSQKVVALYAGAFGTPSPNLYARTFDHDNQAWSAAVLVNNSSTESLGIVVLPETERVLAIQDATTGLQVYYSDDDGTTWSIYARSDLTLTNSTDGGAACMVGDNVLFVGSQGTDYSQAASDSLGAAWDLVEEDTGLGTELQVFELPGGQGAGAAYIDGGLVKFRRLASAYQAISDASPVSVTSAGTATGFSMCADHDGIIYAHIVFSSQTPNECWRSTDLGDTWEEVGDWADTVDNSDNWAAPMRSAPSAGWIVVLSNFIITATSNDASPGATWLGGWSTLYLEQGWGGVYNGLSYYAYIPIDVPNNVGSAWTALGIVAGTIDDTGLRIVTTAQTGYYSRDLGLALSQGAQVQLQVHSGGSLTGLAAGFRLYSVDSTNESVVAFRHTTTTVRIYDVQAGAALGSDLTIDTTTPTVWLVNQTTTTINAWYRKPWETKWTQALSNVAISNAARTFTTSRLQIGSTAAGTADQSFQFVGQGRTISPLDGFDGEFQGKALNTLPYPVPDISPASGERLTRLSLRGGPGIVDETFDVDAEHDYPIEAALGLTGPSPDRRWRSADLTEQLLVWDLGSEAWVGDALALFVGGANFREATLEAWSGAAWVVIGTLNLAEGFESLEYVRAAGCEVVTVAGVTSNADRWLQENEKAGGTIQLGGGKARRIRDHSAGGWTDDGTTVKPTITMDAADDTEPASGSCNLCSPDGVLVVPLAAHTCRRYFAVRIPVQDVPDPYYEAGCILPMRAYALGAPPDWEWSEEVEPNTQITRTTYGTPHGQEQGPPRKVRSWGWNSGTVLRHLRDSVDADYYGTTAGLPLVGREDVLWTLYGLQERSRGGLYPCVLVAGAQDGTTMQTDPGLFLYGVPDFTVSARSANGREGSTKGDAEIMRIERIAVEQIR
jgi:hypothetical protein